jgi:UDP-N-acetyl-D-glucosamine dehydrogenase
MRGDRNRRCGVVGLGFVGGSTLRFLARAGFEVVGYDRSAEAVARIGRQLADELPAGASWSVHDAPDVLAEVKTVLVAVRLMRDRNGIFRTDALQSVGETLRRLGRDGQLVIVESTLPPGTTRRFAREWLGRPAIDVAHAPERLRVGDGDAALRAVPRLVGGLDPAATERACAFLASAGLKPVPVSAPEVSELAKLLENAFLTTSIGLIGEITRLAHAMGLSAHEVTRAAATKPHGYMAFHPGPGIGGHCLHNDLDILRQHAAGLALATPMLDGVAAVAEALPEMAVRELERRLAAVGLGLAGARPLLVGVGFKPGSPDVTATPAIPIVRRLRETGAEPAYLDAAVPVFAVDGVPVPRLRPEELERGEPFTAALVVAGDRTITVERLRRNCRCLLDTGGGAIMPGEFAREERL